MKKKKLIIVEGIPGSGKSTTATNISNFLKSKNYATKLWHENSLNNPVGYLWNEEEILKAIKETNLESYPFHTWLQLNNYEEEYFVLESRLLQNTSLLHLINGGTPEEAFALPEKIISIIENDFDIYLVFLEVSEPKKHLKKIIKERKETHPDWLPFIYRTFDGQPLHLKNNWSGEDGFQEVILFWDKFQKDLVNKLECKKYISVDPFFNWDHSLAKIYDFVV